MNKKINIINLKLILTSLLILAAGFSILKGPPVNTEKSKTQPPQNYVHDNEFMLGAMDCAWDYNFSIIGQLNLNAWHKYTGAVPSGWSEGVQGWIDISGNHIANDWYFAPTTGYGEQIAERITQNRTHSMRSIMDRPKIQYLAMGQRSFYRCVPQANLPVDLQDYWFYTYNTHETGIPEQDNGLEVMHCRSQQDWPVYDNPGFVVKDLKANHEQSDKNWNYWQRDDTYKWYVMPKMRIPMGIPYNTPVCRIQCVNWNGDTVSAQTIIAGNFLDNNNSYNGSYMNEFYFSHPGSPTPITIDAGQICAERDHDFISWPGDPNDTGYIHTDYCIFWYGQCDMWLDYVCVENEPAYELFDEPINIHNWPLQVQQETDLALTGRGSSNYVPNIFYIEEFEFNCIPCIGKLNQIIKSYVASRGVDLSLMVNLNYNLFKVHVPDCWNHDFTSAQLKKYFVDSGEVKTIVTSTYTLPGWEMGEQGQMKLGDNTQSRPYSFHPTTLSTLPYNRYNGVLSTPTSVTNYEDWLHYQLDYGETDGGNFTKVLKLSDEITKLVPDERIIDLTQGHLWWSPGEKLKEPSNEEMDMLINLGISYGSKGILTFWYGANNEYNDPNYYSRGLTGLVSPYPYNTPRTQNVYGQNKWEKMCQINQRLSQNIWGKYLTGFDNINRHTYRYYDQNERTALLNSNNSYFSDIVIINRAR